MAATPYPTDYVYAGNAQTLTLKTAVSDGGGDLTLTVNEETSAEGWPSLGAGQRLVIVVGRGTAYETKYAVKTISSSASGSTLVVDSADKTFDSTPVTAAPAGTEVEHCWSATEASTVNDHMRTKSAHGSDGELVDQNSAQLLSNKTVMTPTASGHPTTKSYVDAADALHLAKAGGTMTGPIAMGGQKITGLPAGTTSGDAVRYEQALLLAGGTMTGKIVLDGDPSSALHPVTKQYADAATNYQKKRFAGTRTTSASLSNSWTDVTGYDSEVDSLSMFDPTTGVATFPVAGLWLVEANISGSVASAVAGDALFVGFQLSTASEPTYDQCGASAPLKASATSYVSLSRVVNVAASDTCKVKTKNTSGFGTTLSFAGFRAHYLGPVS